MTFNRTDQDVRILCLLSGLSFSGSSIHPQNTGCRFLAPCLPRASHFTRIPNLFALSRGLGILLPDYVRFLLLELFIVWLPFRLDPDFPVGQLCCRRPHHARSQSTRVILVSHLSWNKRSLSLPAPLCELQPVAESRRGEPTKTERMHSPVFIYQGDLWNGTKSVAHQIV